MPADAELVVDAAARDRADLLHARVGRVARVADGDEVDHHATTREGDAVGHASERQRGSEAARMHVKGHGEGILLL